MKPELVLWGTKKGNESWQEEIITVTFDTEHLNKAKQWAEDNGFVNLRTSIFDITYPPDFVSTIAL